MEDIGMESHTNYVLIAVLAVISVVAVVLGLLRGKGTPRKKLLRSVLLLGGVALVCFGGEAVLAQFGMGWRCAPYNAMLVLCFVLLIVVLWRCMNALTLLENTDPAIRMSVMFSLTMALVVASALVAVGFHLSKWNDFLAPYDEQMIVCANNCNGGSGAWRYYAHINSIVHGGEIASDGSRWGVPSHWS